jgi:hypothetical protein
MLQLFKLELDIDSFVGLFWILTLPAPFLPGAGFER